MSLLKPSEHDEGEHHPKRFGMAARLRNYLFTGLIIAGPIGITLYVTWSTIQWIDGIVKPFIPAQYNPDTYLPIEVPGVGLIAAIFGLITVGFITASILGRSLISFGESLVDRTPVVRNLYRGLKQIFETALSQKGQSFKRAGLIEYPRRGLWAIVFVSTDARGEVLEKTGDEGEAMASVFLPTTPNPTSGFLLFVPKTDIKLLDMSVEDAAKLVISAGLVMPDEDNGADPKPVPIPPDKVAAE